MADGERAEVALGLPTGEAKTARVRSMFDAIAPRYDLVNRLMTLGLDQGWRRRTVRALGLPVGSLVLDLACGTGDLTRIAGRHGYRTRRGRPLVGHAGRPTAPGARWSRPTPQSCPWPRGSIDGVVCGYALRNFTDLEVAWSRRPGSCARAAAWPCSRWPPRPRALLRAGHAVWFERVVPVLGGLLSDRAAYRYLPRSTVYLPPDPELRRLLRQAGFATVGRRLLNGGLSQLLTATRVGLPTDAPRAWRRATGPATTERRPPELPEPEEVIGLDPPSAPGSGPRPGGPGRRRGRALRRPRADAGRPGRGGPDRARPGDSTTPRRCAWPRPGSPPSTVTTRSTDRNRGRRLRRPALRPLGTGHPGGAGRDLWRRRRRPSWLTVVGRATGAARDGGPLAGPAGRARPAPGPAAGPTPVGPP